MEEFAKYSMSETFLEERAKGKSMARQSSAAARALL